MKWRMLSLMMQLIVFLLLLQTPGDHLQVIGPSQPIVAIVGEDIILPCHLEPAMNASNMRLEWARPDLSPGFVYVRTNGQEYVVHKHPTYRGRTSVSIDRLQLGDISLKLSNARVSDEGTYRCLAPILGRAAFIKLVIESYCKISRFGRDVRTQDQIQQNKKQGRNVWKLLIWVIMPKELVVEGGAVSSPAIISLNRASSSVVLQCESAGWYPEPEVFWLDGEGNLLSAGPTETVRGPDDLYTVSSRVTVEKRHSNNFTCRVQQKDINQTRETHIYISVLSRYVKWLLLTPGFIGVLLCAVFTELGWRSRYQHLIYQGD